MRILQISTHDVRGGAEQVAMNLHRGFRERGHEATLAVGTRWFEEPGVVQIDNASARGLAGRIERRAMSIAARVDGRTNARLVHAAGLVLQPRRLAERILGREDFEMPGSRDLPHRTGTAPDVVHCHNLHGGYFDLRELVPLSKCAPTFLTLHDMWALTGHCAYSLGCERWRDGCGDCPDLTIYPAINRDATRWNLARKRGIYRQCRLRVAAPSRWLLDKARTSALAEGVVEWRLIPYGIDLAVFNPEDRASARARLGIQPDRRVVLYVAVTGRGNPFKDYATVGEAVRRVLQASNDRRLLLLVVGAPGPARTDGNTVHVPFVKSRSALADYYRAADLFLHAAVEDNFPNTVLEAQACGTPVIATSVGGIAEQIVDGVTGVLVPPRGAQEMANAIGDLLRNERRLAIMQGRAAEYARTKYGLDRHVGDYCDWFEEVLNAPDGHSDPRSQRAVR